MCWTAFKMQESHYIFLVMRFEFTSSHSTFPSLNDWCLKTNLQKFVLFGYVIISQVKKFVLDHPRSSPCSLGPSPRESRHEESYLERRRIYRVNEILSQICPEIKQHSLVDKEIKERLATDPCHDINQNIKRPTNTFTSYQHWETRRLTFQMQMKVYINNELLRCQP